MHAKRPFRWVEYENEKCDIISLPFTVVYIIDCKTDSLLIT